MIVLLDEGGRRDVEKSGSSVRAFGLPPGCDKRYVCAMFKIAYLHLGQAIQSPFFLARGGGLYFCRYHGEMKQGKPHGTGTKTWLDESEYVGDFSFGKEVRPMTL